MMYDRPIPGQSLTTEPKNAPYENPPEINNVDEAIMHHIDHLNNEEAAEDILDFIEAGVDVKTLTEAVMRSAVMQGIHSIDISLSIGPVLHEFIRGIPLAAGIDFEEFPNSTTPTQQDPTAWEIAEPDLGTAAELGEPSFAQFLNSALPAQLRCYKIE